jgi:signal transduction histidine kinase
VGIIMGYATFLREETQGDLSEHANRLLSAALDLRTLVEDMTNMNLIYSGKREIHPVPSVLQDILRESCEGLNSLPNTKEYEVVLELPNTPVVVKADEKMKLVFDNILSNAVRFSPEPANILVRLTAEGEKALVEIVDNGIGIPPDKLERIFEQFYQVEEHLTRRYGGLGLGLSIARVLVELHNGRIWAVSKGLGRGATLKVQLPLVQLDG